MPLPRRRYLDPRPAEEAEARPIANAVNLPLEELRGRLNELPPRQRVVEVAGPEPWAERAVVELGALGRQADVARGWYFGEREAGRLWEPNELLLETLGALPPGLAVDLGCGTGREAVFLAAHGWRVAAVDRLADALERGRCLAGRYLSPVEAGRIEWRAYDLSSVGELEPCDLILSFFYLDFGLLRRASGWLRPGGALLVEAFTPEHRARFGRPRGAVLTAAEAGELAGALDVRHLSVGWRASGRHTVRLWAQREG